MKIKEIKWKIYDESAGIYVGFIEDYWYPLPHLFHYWKEDGDKEEWCLVPKLFETKSHRLRSEQECKDKAKELLEEWIKRFLEEGPDEN